MPLLGLAAVLPLLPYLEMKKSIILLLRFAPTTGTRSIVLKHLHIAIDEIHFSSKVPHLFICGLVEPRNAY